MLLSAGLQQDTLANDPQPPGGWPRHDQNRSGYGHHHHHRHDHHHERGSHAHSGRYYPQNPSYRLSRDELREFAEMTLQTIDAGFYFPPGTEAGVDEPYDLKSRVNRTNEGTGFYPPEDEVLANWANASLGRDEGERQEEKKTKIVIGEYSTLVGARKLHAMVQAHEEVKNKTIGVLNFASAKKPGGGFINGAQAQEESIARASTLYPSLITPTAWQFYQYYADDPDNAYYTHAMVYSPSVVLIRNDRGKWKAPVEVDVLTSAAVNAGDVRKQVEWAEEMRELRERVKAAEIKRREEGDRVRKEEDEERRRLEEEEAKARVEEMETNDAEEKGKLAETTTAEGDEVADEAALLTDAEPISAEDYIMVHPEIEPDLVLELEVGVDADAEAAHSPDTPTPPGTSPIIFASDPDPTPPPLPTSSEPTADTGAAQVQAQLAAGSGPDTESPPVGNPLELAELQIAAEMRERIARLLLLFHQRGARHLVLGSFGTGVFKNSVELVAGIFRELLCDDPETNAPDPQADGKEKPVGKGKFKGAFDTVMFAILGGYTVRTFQQVFEGVERFVVDEDRAEPGSDVEAMKDLADNPASVAATVQSDVGVRKEQSTEEERLKLGNQPGEDAKQPLEKMNTDQSSTTDEPSSHTLQLALPASDEAEKSPESEPI